MLLSQVDPAMQVRLLLCGAVVFVSIMLDGLVTFERLGGEEESARISGQQR
jgi:hypothetical protein